LSAALGLGIAAGRTATAAEPAAAVARGLPTLGKGVNLSHWFEYERDQGVDVAEMRRLRVLGLDHVRIPVDPVLGGWDPLLGGNLSFLPELQAAAALAVDAGLEVVVDVHLKPADQQRFEDHPEAEAQFMALWAQIATAFAAMPRERVAFELYNEPQFYGLRQFRWPPLQRRLLASVRQRLPRHLVLVSGHRGGSFEGLSDLKPLDDPQLAYVFHHYEPFLFTHQGAVWQDERYTTAGLRNGLRYPPDQQGDNPVALARPHPKAASDLADYLKSGWGPQRMQAEMGKVAAWARARGIRVVCNEFGVIRANVDVPSRYRWLADMRRALEASGIGWTVWDYTDIFGITAQSAQPGQVGRRTLDPLAANALGLSAAVLSR
jgi:endoglucanase